MSAAPRTALFASLAVAASFSLCLLVYLAFTVPASWFPSASPVEWTARDMDLVRGVGRVVDNELIISATDATGLVLVRLNTNVRASDYAAVAWIASDVPSGVDVSLIWRTEYQPNKLNSAPMHAESRTLMPVMLAGNPAWLGRITGLALAIRGTLPQPIRVRAVIAKPMGAPEVLTDRLREWFSFEGWTGQSINVVTGGADIQDLPLPPLLAAAAILAAAVALGSRFLRRGASSLVNASAVAGIFLVAWLVLDARWTANLARQVGYDLEWYGGKDIREKHLVAEDGELYGIIQQMRALMPPTPVRVFVVSDVRYFRERAAYHLLPHNVYTDRVGGSMPSASMLRAGDWLVVYQGHGMQYDPAHHLLRWDSNETLAAEAKFAAPGAALFLIQ